METILLLDDNYFSFEPEIYYLEQAGYRVIHDRWTYKPLDVYLQNQVDLVIADRNTRCGGHLYVYQLLWQIRQVDPNSKHIILCAECKKSPDQYVCPLCKGWSPTCSHIEDPEKLLVLVRDVLDGLIKCTVPELSGTTTPHSSYGTATLHSDKPKKAFSDFQETKPLSQQTSQGYAKNQSPQLDSDFNERQDSETGVSLIRNDTLPEEQSQQERRPSLVAEAVSEFVEKPRKADTTLQTEEPQKDICSPRNDVASVLPAREPKERDLDFIKEPQKSRKVYKNTSNKILIDDILQDVTPSPMKPNEATAKTTEAQQNKPTTTVNDLKDRQAFEVPTVQDTKHNKIDQLTSTTNQVTETIRSLLSTYSGRELIDEIHKQERLKIQGLVRSRLPANTNSIPGKALYNLLNPVEKETFMQLAKDLLEEKQAQDEAYRKLEKGKFSLGIVENIKNGQAYTEQRINIYYDGKNNIFFPQANTSLFFFIEAFTSK